MTSYRRNFVPGGTYFFTVNLLDRRLRLLVDHIDRLRAAFRHARLRHPFSIDAIVVLPDHLHAIWTLPEGEKDFAVRWNLIKGSFSRGLPRAEPVSDSRLRGANAGFGSAGIGSTQFGTKKISPGMSITSTSIRSSTGTWSACRTGRFPPSIGWSASAAIPKHGLATPKIKKAASANVDRRPHRICRMG
jgi:putative transposase